MLTRGITSSRQGREEHRRLRGNVIHNSQDSDYAANTPKRGGGNATFRLLFPEKHIGRAWGQLSTKAVMKKNGYCTEA